MTHGRYDLIEFATRATVNLTVGYLDDKTSGLSA
jgi:hypothetical protein